MSKKISLVLMAGTLVATAGCGLFKKSQPVLIDTNGTIAQGDSVLAEDNSLYDDYEVQVESGWVIRATMTSAAFDTYLIILDPAGNRAATNDDVAAVGGNGTNSQITYTATQSGKFHVYANSLRAGETGAYHLLIQAGPADALPPAPPALPAVAAAPAAPAPIAPAP